MQTPPSYPQSFANNAATKKARFRPNSLVIRLRLNSAAPLLMARVESSSRQSRFEHKNALRCLPVLLHRMRIDAPAHQGRGQGTRARRYWCCKQVVSVLDWRWEQPVQPRRQGGKNVTTGPMKYAPFCIQVDGWYIQGAEATCFVLLSL